MPEAPGHGVQVGARGQELGGGVVPELLQRAGDADPAGVPPVPVGHGVREPLTGHDGPVEAVAVGALPDGTPVTVTGSDDATVRVWRLADDTPLVPPLHLPKSVGAVAVHGNVIVTAAGTDLAVHQLALPRPKALAAVLYPGTRLVGETIG